MDLVSKAAEMRGVPAVRVARANDRFHKISHPRFGVVWVLRKLGLTQPRIAELLGFKDHTAVGYAIRRAEQLRAEDEAFRSFSDNLYVWALMQEPQHRVAA